MINKVEIDITKLYIHIETQIRIFNDFDTLQSCRTNQIYCTKGEDNLYFRRTEAGT